MVRKYDVGVGISGKLIILYLKFIFLLFNWDTISLDIETFLYEGSSKIKFLVFENKTLLIDFKLCKIFDLSSNKTIYEEDSFSIYDTYKRQMKYFLNCIKSNQMPMNSIEEASSILKLILWIYPTK